MALPNQRESADMKQMWLCQFTGELYDLTDPRIAGLGQPPSSPDTPPGIGRVPMTLVSVDETTGTVMAAAELAQMKLKQRLQKK
jgi:hypothetical protein